MQCCSYWYEKLLYNKIHTTLCSEVNIEMTKNLTRKLEMNYIKSLKKYIGFKSLYNGKPLLKLGYCKYKVII